METRILLNKFNQSIGWNAFLYAIYKVLFTSLSFFLYSRLETQDFSLWANLNAMVFLLLLWLDCGLRKAIPRFAPEFAKNKRAHRGFIKGVILFKIAVLLLALPILMLILGNVLPKFNLANIKVLTLLGLFLFLAEGLASTIKLIFHAHFWNKQFNLLAAAMMVAQMVANWLLIIGYQPNSAAIVVIVFSTKIVASLITVFVSLYLLKHMRRTIDYPATRFTCQPKPWRRLIKHSSFMWGSTFIKSLTERNFIVPALTYTIGPAGANLFKVANDGALLFYRIVLKTIGTTDTSLLTYSTTLSELPTSPRLRRTGRRTGAPKREKALDWAFKKLIKKMAKLCLAAGVIVGCVILIKGNGLFANTTAFTLFTIMVTGYLLEALLSPFERLLEVTSAYRFLASAYLPYIMMLGLFFFTPIASILGLIGAIILVQGMRLTSSLLMIYFSRG